MAADSISVPKLSNNEPSTPNAFSEKKVRPFRATQFWNEAVDNLKTNIDLKRKRVKMKWHDHCFSGCDAVEVVLQHLQQEQLLLHNKVVTREKAIKLCQVMLENHVFEAIHQKPMKDEGREAPLVFEDSSSKLYRFLDDLAKENLYSRDTPDCSTTCENCEAQFIDKFGINREVDADCVSEDGVICNSIAFSKQGEAGDDFLDMSGQWKKYSMSSLKKVLTPAKFFKRTPSHKDCAGGGGHVNTGCKTPFTPYNNGRIPPMVEEEVWREVALATLLTHVEIPLLDQILSYEHTLDRATHPAALSFSNLAFRRYESVHSLFSDKSEDDPWMEAAVDCLECLPDGVELLEQALQLEKTDMTQRLRLFQCIADHYAALPEPLWSEKFIDLHLALLNLLMQDKHQDVLKALQLSMILLPNAVREELVRLLMFMKCASQDTSLILSSQENNSAVVEKTFTSSVIRSKVMAPHQCGQLVLFMMAHASQLAACPQDVEDQVLAKLELMAHGQVTDAKREVTFCTRVSEEQYNKQSRELTELLLVDLINSIIDDTKITLKEKKHKLKQFHKHHTVLFEKHFSGLA